MKNKKKSQRSKTKIIIPVVVVAAVVGTSSMAKAGFLDTLLGGGGSGGGSSGIGSVFQSLSSGSFNFGNIGQILSGISSTSQSPTTFGLGNLSSSGATAGSYGTGSLGSITGGFSGGSGSGSGGVFGGSGGNNGYSTTNLGGFSSGSGGGISPATIQKITTSAGYVKNLYGLISGGNIGKNLGGILNNGVGLLGALGVIDPADLTAAAGSAGSSLGGLTGSSGSTGGGTSIPSIDDQLIDATEPYEIWQFGNKKQSVYPEANYNISQISLGKEGQELSASQTAESTVGVSASQDAAEAISGYVNDAAKLNESQDQAAQSAAKLAEACSADKQSLDCLKKISGGLGVISGQNALVSAGQTLQIAATYHNANIGAANAAIAKINGDRLQKIEIQAAATNNGVTVLAGLADQERQYQLTQNQADLRFLTKTQGSFIVPGLFK